MYVRLMNCLKTAIAHQVSDIHFSIKEDDVLIEMRVNDKMKRLKKDAQDLKLFRYLKYKSNIDLSNVNKPQSGTFEMMVDQQKIALRFSIIQSFQRTSAVLRLLNYSQKLSIQDLTWNTFHITFLKNMTRYKNGLLLISGPTGSGKTTTLYTILNSCKHQKIYTLEDPIEIFNESYVQLQVNEKQGLTYQEGVKQLLRHDPDIIVIGEIRDAVTAAIAIQCALTGHLVLSTIHAESCLGAIVRLMDLGIDKQYLKAVLKGISNQRLLTTPTKKIGAYEVMDRNEVNYCLTHEKESNTHQTMVCTIQEAIQKGIVQEKEVDLEYF